VALYERDRRLRVRHGRRRPDRRYHGLLVAALKPPLGRTLLAAKADDHVEYDGLRRPLFGNRWADSTVDPHGYQDPEDFRLEGTTPVWTYACADARLEKRVFMSRARTRPTSGML
jgi:glycogen debranching enzyme-like protein